MVALESEGPTRISLGGQRRLDGIETLELVENRIGLLLARGYDQKTIERMRVGGLFTNLGRERISTAVERLRLRDGEPTIESWVIGAIGRGEIPLLEAVEKYDWQDRRGLDTTDPIGLRIRYPELRGTEIRESLGLDDKAFRRLSEAAKARLGTRSPLQGAVVAIAAKVSGLDLSRNGMIGDQDRVINGLLDFEDLQASPGFDWKKYLRGHFPLPEEIQAKADSIYQQKISARKSEPEDQGLEKIEFKSPEIYFRPKPGQEAFDCVKLMLKDGIGVVMLGRRGRQSIVRLLAAAPTADDLIRGLNKAEDGVFSPIASIVDDSYRSHATKDGSCVWQETSKIEGQPSTNWRVFIIDSQTSDARQSVLHPWAKQIITHLVSQCPDSNGQIMQLPAELIARLDGNPQK